MALTFLQSAVDATNATVYTFSAQNLGTASADRYIVCTGASGSVGRTLVSVSVAGITATISLNLLNAGGENVWIAIAAVPTGTSGDVVVTFNLGEGRCGIALYGLTDLLSTTPTSTLSDESAPLTGTLTLTNNAAVIAVSQTNTGVVPTCTWTGLTEDFDATIEGNASFSGASLVLLNTATVDVTALWTDVTSISMVAATFPCGASGHNLTMLGVGK